MNKKQSIKQQYILIILFMIGNYMLVNSYLSKDLKEKILNSRRNSMELTEAGNFITNRLPTEKYDLKELEQKITNLEKLNADLKKSLFGISKASQSTTEKINQLNLNASDLNIKIFNSSTSIDEKETVYKIEFISTFQQISSLIQNSYDKPGEISIKYISFVNNQGLLKTSLEFSL